MFLFVWILRQVMEQPLLEKITNTQLVFFILNPVHRLYDLFSPFPFLFFFFSSFFFFLSCFFFLLSYYQSDNFLLSKVKLKRSFKYQSLTTMCLNQMKTFSFVSHALWCMIPVILLEKPQILEWLISKKKKKKTAKRIAGRCF